MGIKLNNSISIFEIGNRKTRGLKDSLTNKFIAWYKPTKLTESYYINQIGAQDREALSQSDSDGIIHAGKAIQLDGTKTQYATTAVTPANYRLINNSISYCFWIKMGASLPASNIPLFGSDPNIGSGRYYSMIDDKGRVTLSAREDSSTKAVNTTISINDNTWYHVFAVIDKTGYMGLYLDNVQQLSLIDISASTFGDINEGFKIGESAARTIAFQLRDIRIFPFAITSRTDRDSIMNGEYYAGACGWWMCERDNYLDKKIKDSTNTLHFTTFNFDSNSLVSGNWKSLYNKFGYANAYTGIDLLSGSGNFDDVSKWTINATRYTISNGILTWLAAGDTAPYCVLVATVNLSNAIYYEWTFTVLSGTARMRLMNQSAVEVLAVADYAVGTHKIVFKPSATSTKFSIQSYQAGGAYTLDNVSIGTYEYAYISPLMTSNPPVNDIIGRALVFKEQAKYNLIRVNGDTVKLPSYIKELYDACELITVNDWYDENGIGNEIDIANIAPYQAKRQYYKDGQLIIIKADQIISDYEDYVLRSYLRLGNLTKSYFPVKLSLGLTEGTTAQIYATIPVMLAEETYTQDVLFSPVRQVLNPEDDYLSIEWADFFQTDVNSIIPLTAKYGFSSTFIRQIKPSSDNPLTTIYYNRSELPLIEQSGQREGNHGFGHIGQHINAPLYDGLNTPSNDDMRTARANGTNEFGCTVTDTVSQDWGEGFCTGWLLLPLELINTAWEDLTNAQCQTIRESLAIFTLPLDGQGEQKVLESLDILSERYCGTTGTSVYNGDYSPIRVPNTIDGLPPSPTNRIIGGVFQGSSTTENHEVWERILVIDEQYKREFEYLNIRQTLWGTPVGVPNRGLYHAQDILDVVYQDRARTKLATGTSKHTSSITGQERSWFQCLRNAGYRQFIPAMGMGFSENNWDVSTADERFESQRIHKKNGCKKLDEVGDGYVNAMRNWDSSIPQVDQETLLAATDLIKDLYDYTISEERYEEMFLLGETYPFYEMVNTLCKYNAWGMTPDCGGDSSTGTVVGRASVALVMEALYQFCKRAGKKVISFEEAIDLQNVSMPANYNYFPNSTFKTTPKTILDSINCPSYPDGWNGGALSNGEVTFTVGSFFTRQYAIKSGIASLSIQVKGIGTILIKKIINDDTYDNVNGALFAVVKTLVVNSVEFTEVNDLFIIPELTIEDYETPTTPKQIAYQEYMRGYGKNWCGIQIEVIVTGINTLTIKAPSIIIN